MQQQQLQAVKVCLDCYAGNHVEKTKSYLSDRDDFSWEICPGSFREHLGLGNEGKLDKVQALEMWKKVRCDVLKDVKTLELRNVIQKDDVLACRVITKETTIDGRTYEGDNALFVMFDPGTDTLLQGVEISDSARRLDAIKRLNIKFP
ncbi:hypothetical protein JCM21900_000369 [Sporobolomyces salmonicolor]